MKKTPFLAHFASFLLILAKYNCAKFERKKTTNKHIPRKIGFKWKHARTSMNF